MAKALFGHVGVGADLRLTSEVHRLRCRVAELETKLAEARDLNDALTASVVSDDLRELDAEPALT